MIEFTSELFFHVCNVRSLYLYEACLRRVIE